MYVTKDIDIHCGMVYICMKDWYKLGIPQSASHNSIGIRRRIKDLFLDIDLKEDERFVFFKHGHFASPIHNKFYKETINVIGVTNYTNIYYCSIVYNVESNLILPDRILLDIGTIQIEQELRHILMDYNRIKKMMVMSTISMPEKIHILIDILKTIIHKEKNVPPDSMTCCVCMEYIKKRYAIVPCGHAYFCGKCIKLKDSCMICSCEIEKTIPIYY